MGKEYYILQHPVRVFVEEECEFLEKQDNKWIKKSGNVVIPVDNLEGNQDPYVFNRPWFYGYCKNHNIKRSAGKDSIIVFGTYHNYRNFFVDTIFTVYKKYDWQDSSGLEPSESFYKVFKGEKILDESSKNYKDFLYPRIVDREHESAKSIYKANMFSDNKHAEYRYFEEDKEYFSFIPLFKDENGIYRLIDVLDIIKKYNPSIFENFDKEQLRLYNISRNFIDEIYDELLKRANILVVNTRGIGSPNKLDIELQKKYFKEIYGIEEIGKIIKQKCTRKNRQKCY